MGKVAVGSQNSKKTQLPAGSRGGLSVNISIREAQGSIFCSYKCDLSRDAVLLLETSLWLLWGIFLPPSPPFQPPNTKKARGEGGDIIFRLRPPDEGR